MMERRHAARRPPESFFRVPQIAHDVSVFPAAFLRARSAQVSRRRRSVVHCAQPAEQKGFVTRCARSPETTSPSETGSRHGRARPTPPTPVKEFNPFRDERRRTVVRVGRHSRNRWPIMRH